MGRRIGQEAGAAKESLRHGRLIASATVLLVLLAYVNSFGAGFAFDSRGLVVDDSRVHEWSAANLTQIWRHTYWWPVGESGLYRPFTTLSFLLNWSMFGGSAGGYHAVNFLLHALNVWLVWLLARRLWNQRWTPLLIAVLWAVHPVLTESVTNVAGRADLLAGTALLGGFLFYLKSEDDWRWLFALSAITTIGVFSKESAVTIAGIIVLYELLCRTGHRRMWSVRSDATGPSFPIRPDGRQNPIVCPTFLWGLAAVLPPILWMLYQRSTVLAASAASEFPFTDNPLVGAGFWSAGAGALNIVGRYIGLLLWPAQLSCDYSYAQIPVSGGVWDWALIAATLACVICRRSLTALFLAGAAFLVFLPSSNLLFPIGTVMAERFLYLPSIAFAAAVVWAAYRFSPRHASVIVGVLVAMFAIRTLVRNSDWHDDLTLSESAVRVCPASFKTHKMRANALLEADPSHANLDQVIDEAERSLAILDSLPPARNNFDTYERTAGYYFMKGDRGRQRPADGAWVNPPESAHAYQRAIDLYHRALTMARQPAPGVYQQLAKLYLRLGQSQQALDAALRARQLAPNDPAVHRTLAGVLLDAGRDEDTVVAMVAGVIITNDEALRQDLIRMYRAGLDPEGCAVGGDGLLNTSCPTVHRNLCAASADVLRLRPDLAGPMTAYHCR
jgi:tetratricopeptide (TPR) repeat protein